MVLNLLFLPAGPYLVSCLEESRGWASAAGWCRTSIGCRVPLPLDDIRGFVSLGVDPGMSLPATLAVLAFKVIEFCPGQLLCRDGRCGRTLALRVTAKLCTLSLSESILLPRVHDELGGSEQTLQRRLGDIGRILLEGLLQMALEQSAEVLLKFKLK